MSVNYMLISVIILAVAIAIPFLTFEKRKPKARQNDAPHLPLRSRIG